MARQIYMVYANIVDANGNRTIPEGYPKAFDSKTYGGDIDRTERKAEADASTIWASMCNNDAGRLLQSVILQTVDGFTLSGYPKCLGTLAEPEPAE